MPFRPLDPPHQFLTVCFCFCFYSIVDDIKSIFFFATSLASIYFDKIDLLQKTILILVGNIREDRDHVLEADIEGAGQDQEIVIGNDQAQKIVTIAEDARDLAQGIDILGIPDHQSVQGAGLGLPSENLRGNRVADQMIDREAAQRRG